MSVADREPPRPQSDDQLPTPPGGRRRRGLWALLLAFGLLGWAFWAVNLDEPLESQGGEDGAPTGAVEPLAELPDAGGGAAEALALAELAREQGLVVGQVLYRPVQLGKGRPTWGDPIPLADVTVLIARTDRAVGGAMIGTMTVLKQVTSDSEGRFSFPVPDAPEFWVAAISERCEPTRVVSSSLSRRNAHQPVILRFLEALPGTSLQGRVVSAGSGAPIGGVRIVTAPWREEVVTDADGRFALAPRKFGANPSAWLDCWLPGVAAPFLWRVTDASVVQRIRVPDPVRVVSGDVVDLDGKPVQCDLELRIKTGQGFHQLVGSSDANGRFSFGGLVPGFCLIQTTDPAMTNVRLEPQHVMLRLVDGRDLVGLTLVVDRSPRRVFVHWRTDDPAPPTEATVGLSYPVDRGGTGRTFTSDNRSPTRVLENGVPLALLVPRGRAARGGISAPGFAMVRLEIPRDAPDGYRLDVMLRRTGQRPSAGRIDVLATDASTGATILGALHIALPTKYSESAGAGWSAIDTLLVNLPLRPLDLLIIRPGWSPGIRRGVMPSTATPCERTRIRMSRHTSTVGGRVLDKKTGVALSGVRVSVVPPEFDPAWLAHPRVRGTMVVAKSGPLGFETHAPLGAVKLRFERDDYAPKEIQLTAPAGDVEIALDRRAPSTPRAVFSVVFHNARSGEIVRDAKWELWTPGYAKPIHAGVGPAIYFEGPGEGWWIEARIPGHAAARLDVTPSENQRLELSADGR